MRARLTSHLLTDGDVDAHRTTLEELAALAREDPAQRQLIADEVCRYLREAAEQTCAHVQAVALLTTLARQHPDVGGSAADASCDAGCAHRLDLALDGAVLPDVDFGGCHLGDVSFADTHFRGASVFTGTRFAELALFQRSVFEGDASFAGARFHRAADFGRARFRADADFSRARFQSIAWFGRGEEGGDGVRFNRWVSFADATFGMEAWFWKARFGGAVSFQRCAFGGRVHLIQPAVDLTGARLTATARARGEEWPEGQDWPFGWATASELEDDGAALVVLDTSLSPYHLHLAGNGAPFSSGRQAGPSRPR